MDNEKNRPEEKREPSIQFYDPQGEFRELRKRQEHQIDLIIGIFGVAIITLIAIVGSVVIDSFHFNSVVYQQYTQSNQELQQMAATNQQLLQKLQSENKQVVPFPISIPSGD